MSEPKPIYDAETVDSLEMLGKGYDQEYIRKELPAVMSGFTPAPDVLITEFGFVTALVWGKVWRYCQMSDGICRAKLETLAGQLGMSVRTIIRHIEPLVEAGYLKDITPDLKNRPHIYADTGKVRIRISVEATMTKSQSTMTESHSDYDRESLEESKRRKNNQEQPKGDLVDAVLFYEQKPTTIRMAIKEHFRLNVNWETKTARQWMEWAVGENITPEQLARAADLWRKDKQFNWQVPTLKGIFEKWPMLMSENEEIEFTRLL